MMVWFTSEKINNLLHLVCESAIDKKEREWCENYLRGYGWGSAAGKGKRTERFFDQIPECVEAFDAWNNRER